MPYWPAGTVFVSVVDPGVGTNRKSVVARTKTGQYIVTPDNGTLTFLAEKVGIDAVREIDETKNRRAGSEASYTFHGRDVYAYTGARLASGVIGFDGVGPETDPAKIVKIAHEETGPRRGRRRGGRGHPGAGPAVRQRLDGHQPRAYSNALHPAPKPGDRFAVIIEHLGDEYLAFRAQHPGEPWMRKAARGTTVFRGTLPYANSFGEVPVGQPLLYLNSLMQVSFALNQGNFAAANHVGCGPEWGVIVRRVSEDAK